ncbi:DNA helicase UvrD [candidate division WWE3 bacterium]|uniref:DNA helicase UvrD n=1 Tax=candidate division WWE3 bacterium TaxID=2053526 RepID=A0A955LI20_UNCKA|nr:DNA helicase UvrD [candidate division WWE3 bacterium]
MRFIADLHLHSRFAYACSKTLSIEELTKWGMFKGITLLATGDFTHPLWFDELQNDLIPIGNGLFRPKDEIIESVKKVVPKSCHREVYFMLECEVSCIYSKNDRVRKVHHLIYAPDFETVREINSQLAKIGNLTSDGRPILGIDSGELLKIVLQSSDSAYLVPAHAWTPHFAIFGSNSGFDSLEECFGDLTEHIFAIETGLSSDPEMNRLWSKLDTITLISGSDSHSARRIGREANIFDTDLTYDGVWSAIKENDRSKFIGTFEFFPHEGRYHYDGHRNCKILYHPTESADHNNLCPTCGKPLTLGVLHRVMALSDRTTAENVESYQNLIPLDEAIAEVKNVKGVQSKAVQQAYFALIDELGPELEILSSIPIDAIAAAGGRLLAEAIKRIRSGSVSIKPGYDGLYGEIHIFTPHEREKLERIGQPQQPSLF